MQAGQGQPPILLCSVESDTQQENGMLVSDYSATYFSAPICLVLIKDQHEGQIRLPGNYVTLRRGPTFKVYTWQQQSTAH